MKEQEELHRNLGTTNSVLHQQQAEEEAAGLRSLLEQGDLLEEEMKKEKQARMELEKEVWIDPFIFGPGHCEQLMLGLFSL